MNLDWVVGHNTKNAMAVAKLIDTLDGLFSISTLVDTFNLISDELDQFGVESVAIPDCNDHLLYYINNGESYDPTLCYDPNEGLMVTSWGDWWEQAEQDHKRCEG